jgi:hypothetical protein
MIQLIVVLWLALSVPLVLGLCRSAAWGDAE